MSDDFDSKSTSLVGARDFFPMSHPLVKICQFVSLIRNSMEILVTRYINSRKLLEIQTSVIFSNELLTVSKK